MIYMLELALKSNVVREKFSTVVDEVIRDAPKVVSRTRDHFVMMNLKHIETLIKDFTFHVNIQNDEDGSFIATLDEVDDLIGYKESPDEALYDLAEQLIDYSKEYLHESFSLYFNAPNRRKHFPYVMKVMMQNSIADVIQLFSVKP